MSKLLVISSASATLVNDKPYLDTKFYEGMHFYCKSWKGEVSCILTMKDSIFPFGQVYEPSKLPFDLKIIPESHLLDAKDIERFDLILCSGDNHRYLHLADICKGMSTKIIFIIEYILETRCQIIFLDRSRTFLKKAYSLLWTLNQERRRRRAFRISDGLQANGYPAMATYSLINMNTVFYLDNRLRSSMLATVEEMKARSDYLTNRGRLRILHSGRLEPMKGAHDLIPIAKILMKKGIDFELNIFGAGSLEDEIKSAIHEANLKDRVRLHGVVDFETELVPFARLNADIFLSCHRQSDPSCSYIESMGCGLPIAGYANRMWAALSKESGSGWTVSLGDTNALAQIIAQTNDNRSDLIEHCEKARKFAGHHTFEIEFKSRIKHLIETVSGKAQNNL